MKKLLVSIIAVLTLVGIVQAKQATTQYERALINAAKEGNAAQVRGLLEAGTDPNVTDNRDGSTPLMHGAKQSSVIVDMLLYAGADISATDNKGCTALIYSFMNIGPQANAIRQRLLKENPDVTTICTPLGYTSEELLYAPVYHDATALSFAIADNDMDGVKLLLKHGADVNAPLFHLPLTTALLSKEKGSSKMVELLLNEGANPWLQDMMGAYSGTCSSGKITVEEDAKCALITKAKSAMKAQHKKDENLYQAAKDGNAKKVKKLLTQGANPNYAPSTLVYNTPLTITQSTEVAQALVNGGANINRRDGDGATPLFNVKTAEIAKVLINAGADVNARHAFWSQTPLFKVDSVEKAQVLINAGANVNARDSEGATPLFYAKTADIAKALIKAGADVKATDNTKANALFNAKANNRTEVATLLERYGLTTTGDQKKTIAKIHANQELRKAREEARKAQQSANDDGESLGKTFLKGVAQAGAATLQYGIENNKF